MSKPNKKQLVKQLRWKPRQSPAERPLSSHMGNEIYAKYENFIREKIKPIEERFFEETDWTFNPTKFGFGIHQQQHWDMLSRTSRKDYKYSKGWYALKHIGHNPKNGESLQVAITQLSHCDYEIVITNVNGLLMPVPGGTRKINYNIPNEEVAKIIFEAQKFLEVLKPAERPEDVGMGTGMTQIDISREEFQDMLRKSLNLPLPKPNHLCCPYCGVRHSGALVPNASPHFPQKHCSACGKYFD